MTRSVMLGLAATLVAGSLVQATQTVKKSESVSATATIQAIDKANRLVTLKDEKGVEDTGVEVRAASFIENLKALRARKRHLVRTLRTQRVEHIGYGCQTAFNRDIFPGKSQGIAGPVKPLVVRLGDAGR